MEFNTEKIYQLRSAFGTLKKGAPFKIVASSRVMFRIETFSFPKKIIDIRISDIDFYETIYNVRNFIDNSIPFEVNDLGEYYPLKQFNGENYKEDNKKEVIDNFKLIESLYKYVPLRIGAQLHYYKDNKIYSLNKNKVNIKLHPRLRYQKNDNTNGKVSIKNINLDSIVNNLSIKDIVLNYKFKVIDYRKSAKLFGFSGIKKEMVGKTYEASKAEHLVDVKKSTEKENTVTLIFGGRNIKFSLEDLKIITPNISGWNISKDRTINAGSKVLVIKNKDIRSVRVGQESVVEKIKKVGDKRYALITIDGKKVYSSLKNLKLINNDKQEQQEIEWI